MKNKTVFYNRSAIHYRERIYKKLESELNVDFFFGDKRPGGIIEIDYSKFNNIKGILVNKNFNKFYWQIGVFNNIFLKSYKNYLTPGDYFCLSNWFLLPLLKLSGKKVYFWSHGWYGKESKFEIFLKKIFFKFSDGIFLYGNYAKDLMIQNGFDPNKLHVVYNSLDYDKQILIRKNLIDKNKSIASNKFEIVFIGRLTRIKKLDILLEAFHQLKEENIECNLTIIGTGSEENRLINYVKDNNLGSYVTFLGEMYDEHEIANVLYNANLCVSPGNVGLTAMHCMMYGLPVITHNNFSMQMPEYESIIKGETGDFFEYNNVDDLALKIKKWKSNNYDRLTIQNMCFSVIDKYYNPNYQIKIFKQILKS